MRMTQTCLGLGCNSFRLKPLPQAGIKAEPGHVVYHWKALNHLFLTI